MLEAHVEGYVLQSARALIATPMLREYGGADALAPGLFGKSFGSKQSSITDLGHVLLQIFDWCHTYAVFTCFAMEDGDVYEPPAKRFKVCYAPSDSFGVYLLTRFVFPSQHQSYQQELKDVHLPSALAQSKFDHDIAVTSVYYRFGFTFNSRFLFRMINLTSMKLLNIGGS